MKKTKPSSDIHTLDILIKTCTHWLRLFLLYLPPDYNILNKIPWGVSNCSFHNFSTWPYRRATACLTAVCLFTLHGLSGKVYFCKSKKNFLFFPTQMKRKCTHCPRITAIGFVWSFFYSSNKQARAEKTESAPKPEELTVLSSTKLKDPQICLMRFTSSPNSSFMQKNFSR